MFKRERMPSTLKKSKEQLFSVFIRFLNKNKYIKINFTSFIYSEQFAALSFHYHFLNIFVFQTCLDVVFETSGWILLDKMCDKDEEKCGEYTFDYKIFLSLTKNFKKKVSYDLRNLKRFEQDRLNCEMTNGFIEQVVATNESVFRRTALRQIKRIFNQRKLMCAFKIQTQPSRLNSVADVWLFLEKYLEQLYARFRRDDNDAQVREQQESLVDLDCLFEFEFDLLS